ncbi:hypothetical protein [Brevibacillus sp. SIMBA_076]|uniref:hypothetical protein n=1 Tax=Brevibacillus sp. SIMBA_076 TaxID=3085814 RepID=UPI003977FB00
MARMDATDKCIYCKEELASWERNRSECMDCRDKHPTETYSEYLEEDSDRKTVDGIFAKMI